MTRTIDRQPRRGAEAPGCGRRPSGLLNCVGMQNPGYEKFTQVFYKGLVGYDVPIIASVTGTPEEIRRMADALAELPAVAGVEVNLHCTYEEYRTLGSKAYLEQCAQRIRCRRRRTAAGVGEAVALRRRHRRCGADGTGRRGAGGSMRQHLLGHGPAGGRQLTAGQHGGRTVRPAIRPLSVFQTWRVAQEVAVDVVGCGGIVCAADVKEYMAAGAKAVEIGTANFTEPETIIRITEAL